MRRLPGACERATGTELALLPASGWMLSAAAAARVLARILDDPGADADRGEVAVELRALMGGMRAASYNEGA